MKWTLMLTFMIAIVARAEDAHACSCGMPRITISPDGVDAPINTTIVVWIPSYVSKGSEVALSLRKKVSGDTITVDYRNIGSAATTVIELMPKTKLAANSEYEIVRNDLDAPQVVGSFTTGTREVTGTPAWKGIAKANYYKAVPVCCMCMTADPYAEIVFKEPLDDKKATQYRVAIWMAGADGKIDYRKSPVTYDTADSTMWLGHPSTCSPANFLFPKQKALKLGFKLVDLAGNASSAAEVTLDTTKPVRPPNN